MTSLLDMMGYHFTDLGPLRRARDIENIPLYLFLNWRRPLAVSTRNSSLSCQPPTRVTVGLHFKHKYLKLLLKSPL